MDMGGEGQDLYCDTGSNITIIIWAMYKRSMGKIVAARSYLRAWGSDEYLRGGRVRTRSSNLVSPPREPYPEGQHGGSLENAVQGPVQGDATEDQPAAQGGGPQAAAGQGQREAR